MRIEEGADGGQGKNSMMASENHQPTVELTSKSSIFNMSSARKTQKRRKQTVGFDQGNV